MRDLLVTGIHRYLKTIVFWVMLASTVLLGAYAGHFTDWHYYMEDIHLLGLFMIHAVLVSLVVGAEFSTGNVRNKIIAGFKKSTIYLSEILLSLIFSTVFCFVFAVLFLFFNPALFSVLSAKETILFSCVYYLMNVAVTVFCTTVCFFVPYKAVIGVVINLCLLFMGYFGSDALDFMLNQPENLSLTLVHDDGTEEEQFQSNPEYIPPDSFKWKALHTVYYMMPTGQVNEYVSDMSCVLNDTTDEIHFNDLQSAPYYSLAAIVIVTLAGTVCFQRKDLK